MQKLSRAVITGASSGIGEAFASEPATQGVNLIIAARRTNRHQGLGFLSLSRETQTSFLERNIKNFSA